MVNILKNNSSDFEDIKEWEYEENFYTLNTEYGNLRIHYVDEGSNNDKTVLLLHGETDWGYIYRKFINPLVESGLRVVVPDLPGFGKADKLSERTAYTYEKYDSWMNTWLRDLNIENITLFGQDWGDLIGIRVVVDNQYKFSSGVVRKEGHRTGD